jgi:hypothetical protein
MFGDYLGHSDVIANRTCTGIGRLALSTRATSSRMSAAECGSLFERRLGDRAGGLCIGASALCISASAPRILPVTYA